MIIKILCLIFSFRVVLWITDTEQKLLADLKEILPNLISAKDILGKAKVTTEEVTDLKNQVTKINGTITELDKKYIELGNKRIAVKDSGLKDEQKIDFCKWIINVYKSGIYGGTEDRAKVLKEMGEKYAFTPERKAALNEGTTTQGGYGVPDMFAGMIWREAAQASIALSECTLMPLTKGYKVPIISANAKVSIVWEDEAAAFDESEPTFAKSATAAKKMAAYSLISNELLEDEEFEPSLADYLIQLFAEAMGTEIDNQTFQGSGSPFTGLLAASGVNEKVMDSGDGAFSKITFDYLSNMLALIKSGSLANAKWLLHRTILDYLRIIQSTAGGYVYAPPGVNQPGTIWGYPYIISEEMPSSSDTGVSTTFVGFGNLKNIVLGTKGDMTVLVSKELKMLNDQTVMAFRRRIAIVVALAAALARLKTNSVNS